MTPERDDVAVIKSMRVGCDALFQQLRDFRDLAPVFQEGGSSDAYETAAAQASIKLQEAKMWLGKMLEGIGNPFPKELADKAPRPAGVV